MDGYVKLLDSLGAPGAALLVAAAGALIWIGRQLIVLRRNIENLRADVGASQRNAIVDAWDRLLQLRERGLTTEEAELLKSQLLATIPIDREQGRSESERPTVAPEGGPTVQQVEPTLAESLVRFGFFGVWAIGWGTGMTLFLGGATLWLGASTLEATSILGVVGYALATLAAALAYLGLGVVLPLGALAASLRGLLDFMRLSSVKLGAQNFAERLAVLSTYLEKVSAKFGG